MSLQYSTYFLVRGEKKMKIKALVDFQILEGQTVFVESVYRKRIEVRGRVERIESFSIKQ